jgi:uncharacterized integral membrane protein
MSSDPYASPDPSVTPAGPSQSVPPAVPSQIDSTPAPPAPTVTRAAALWSSLILGLLVLIVLLVFITQNTDSVSMTFLGWHWSLPLGVQILVAAVCGALITVLVGTARIYQLRRAVKKNLKAGR